MDLKDVKIGELYTWFRSRKGHNYSCELIESRVISKTRKTVRVEYREDGIVKTYSCNPDRLEKVKNQIDLSAESV